MTSTSKNAAPKLATTYSADPTWQDSANALMAKFAIDHGVILGATERQLSAAFEIACFHALLYFYKRQGYTPTLVDLRDGEYRYLTSPSGNPANFSFVRLTGPDGEFEVRQQVRIESHVDPDIRFTPDLVVVVKNATINAVTLENFASGKRKLFSVNSSQVVAAHECKSMNPFPELMVNFIGMLVTAHAWYPNGPQVVDVVKGHLAPTLFVGGTARAFYLKMVSALETAYRLNIVVGMHSGTWDLKGARRRLSWVSAPLASALPVVPAAVIK